MTANGPGLSVVIDQAREAERRKCWSEALAHWRAVRARDPDHMWAHLRIGILQGELGHYEEAMQCLQQAVARWPDHIAPLQSLAHVAFRGRCWAEALAHWQEVAKRNPDNPYASRFIGLCLAEMKAYSEAEEVLQEAVCSAPHDPTLRIRLAQAAAAQGHFDLALRQVEEAEAIASGAHLNKIGHGLIACGYIHRALCYFRSLTAADHQAPPQERLDPRRTRAGRQPRALVLDPNFKELVGHHYNLNRFYRNFLEQYGFTVDLVCRYPILDARVLAEKTAHPYFTVQTFVEDAWVSTFEAVMRFNAYFKTELDDLLPYCDADVIVFHSARVTIIHGIARWLKEHFEGAKVVVILGIIEADHIDTHSAHYDIAQRVYRQALDILKQVQGLSLILFGETRPVTAFLQSVTEHPFYVDTFPYLAAHLSKAYASEPLPMPGRSRLRIGYLGMTRKDRGTHLVPGIILAAQDQIERPLEWLVQLNLDGVRALGGTRLHAQIEALTNLESVRLYETGLAISRYYALFAKIDILLLPYDTRYQFSGSGVFFEAMALGKVLIVPGGSFMETVLEECGGQPVVFEELTPEAVLKALCYAVAHFDEIATKARTATANWLHPQNGKEAFERIFLEKAKQVGLDLAPGQRL